MSIFFLPIIKKYILKNRISARISGRNVYNIMFIYRHETKQSSQLKIKTNNGTTLSAPRETKIVTPPRKINVISLAGSTNITIDRTTKNTKLGKIKLGGR